MFNTITCNAHTFTVAKKQRPFSNDFKQLSSKIVQYKGQDEILAYVQCTSSKEFGRIYAVSYNFAGEMLGCTTVN